MAVRHLCDGCNELVGCSEHAIEVSVLRFTGCPPNGREVGRHVRHFHLRCFPLDPPELAPTADPAALDGQNVRDVPPPG